MNNDRRWYILSVLSLALAFLQKPFVGFWLRIFSIGLAKAGQKSLVQYPLLSLRAYCGSNFGTGDTGLPLRGHSGL